MIRAGDQHMTERRIHVGQGEHYVTSDPDVVLSTVLGSCVAMCLRDPVAGVGGMNHFLLPEGAGAGTDAGRRYGAYAMELLINDVLKAGGRRDRLQAKLFGGGRMFDSLKDVGT
ncbi:chemotaxis protein CheD, partial [Brevundimonas sp.]|uniref:chemotaxis protein CheD n=2 Tax=Brevundimonas TaxID=41275 RepID=UPI002F175FD4